MAPASGALSPRSEGADRAPEDGVRRAARRLAAWSLAGLGRIAAVGETTRCDGFSGWQDHSPLLERTSFWQAELAISAMGRADVRGVAGTVGVITRWCQE